MGSTVTGAVTRREADGGDGNVSLLKSSEREDNMNTGYPLATLRLTFISLIITSQATASTLSSDTPLSPTAPTTSTPVNAGSVIKSSPPERAVTTVNKATVEHAAPTQSFQSILRNIPGMNVVATGPGNLSATNSEFTFDGFNSDQVGSTYDGIPIANPFRGGAAGQAGDHALTPLTLGQISGVSVYSGANTPGQSSIGSLGGTLAYSPKQPSPNPYMDISGSYGMYSHNGSNLSGGITVNSGTIESLGTRILGSYNYTDSQSYLSHVFSNINSYYLNIIQPYNNGLSRVGLIALYNSEIAQAPTLAPIGLINRYGRSFQWPTNVYNNINHTHAMDIILSWKSILNDYMIGSAKIFIEQQHNNALSYGNASYASGYGGYPLPIALHNFQQTDNNLYNPVAAFGSGFNGSQYQRYLDNINTVGLRPDITFMLPHNMVKLGGLFMQSTDHSAEAFYGTQSAPIIDGYNSAWDEHDQRSFANIYLQDKISLMHGHLHIYPGVKYNVVNTSDTDTTGYFYKYSGTVSNTYEYLEPSIGFSYNPTKHFNVYLNVGRSYKVPNISAYYSVIGSGPVPGTITVQPEYVTSYDTGIRYKKSVVSGSLGLFRRSFNNIFSLFYNNVTGITYQYNSGTALYQGLTADLAVKLPYYLHVTGSYGYTDAHYTSSFSGPNGNVTSGMPRPYVPSYTASLGLNYSHNGLYVGLDNYFVGRQYISNNQGTTIGTSMPSYSTLDLTASYKMQINRIVKSLKLSLFLDNLMNTNYLVYEQQQTYPYSYNVGQIGAPFYAGLQANVRF
ncbi:TonB-dependent receptor [Acidithiobacillus sulfuriphilus]|uniref:TonB-dependent receptor n=1 Tax=Acidithiobacillus sulfuriphilus TaxID=1867749 RepID=UPI003F5DA6F5